MMTGWKTWLGAALVGAGSVVTFLGFPEVGSMLTGLGGSIAAVGIAHKIEKNSHGG